MTTEISSGIIENVLRPYKPECRFLKSASSDYPRFSGVFLILPTYYHSPPLKHATDIEIQLCLNKILYACVAEMMENGSIPELIGHSFEGLREENMLIVKSEKIFKKQIRTGANIFGEIGIDKLKRCGQLLAVQTNFQFENKSCFGNLETAIIKLEDRKK
jgi:hypothetical protein